jgi:endonuclease YncB( thermonuclease family)
MPVRPVRRRLSAVGLAAAATVCAVVGGVVPAGAGTNAHETVDGTGRVTYVADGDSPFVNHHDIRLIGVQAPEVRHHGRGRNWCHALAAKRALTNLVYHRKVQLRSMHSNSENLGRPLRSIYVRKDGGWVNVQRDLLQAGKVLWFPQKVETEHNSDYHLIAAQEAETGTGIWDTTFCGAGPAQTADLTIDLRWDANSGDEKHLNGEWVRILNHSDYDVHLGGWHVRDTSLAMFTFPAHVVVPAHGAVTVHSGSGPNPATSTARNFHWNLSHSLFGDVNRRLGEGDEAFLLDPQGDFRAWSDYPCVLDCSDPLKGHVAMTVHYQSRHEYVRIRPKNTSHPIRLGDYQLRSWPFTYVIPRGTFVRPGEVLTIHWGHGHHQSRLVKFAGNHTPMLKDRGGQIDLSTLRDIRIVCVSWKHGSCHYNY